MKRTSQALAIGLFLLGAEVIGASPVLALPLLDRLSLDPRTGEIVLEATGPITPLSSFQTARQAWVSDFRDAQNQSKVFWTWAPDSPSAGLMSHQPDSRWVRFAIARDGYRGSPFSALRFLGKSYRVKLRQPPKSVRQAGARPLGSYQGEPLTVRFEATSLPVTMDASWRWRAMSQMLLSTNIAHFNRGPSVAGARLSYQGTHRSYQPLVKGFLLGHIEQQTLRFAEPRYDYGSLVTSMALSHPINSWLHVFEGGAMLVSAANALQGLSFLDTDLFAGIGTYGAGPGNGLWYGTLTAERMAARALQDSYYGQTLRLGYQVGVASMDFQIQATVQRVDPMILSSATYRAYAQSSMEREVASGVRLGIRALLGSQQRPESFSWFTEGGPYLQASF